MALYFLSYDLRKQRDYQPLYDALAQLNAVHVLESLWCFERDDTTAQELVNSFIQFIDEDDGLVVSQAVDGAYHKPLVN